MKQAVAKPERRKKSVFKSRAKNKNSTDGSKLREPVPGNFWIWEKNKTLSVEAEMLVSKKEYPEMFAMLVLQRIFEAHVIYFSII